MKQNVLMLNDVSGPLACDQLNAMETTSRFDASRVVLVDQSAPGQYVSTAEALRNLRGVARTHGITALYTSRAAGRTDTGLARHNRRQPDRARRQCLVAEPFGDDEAAVLAAGGFVPEVLADLALADLALADLARKALAHG